MVLLKLKLKLRTLTPSPSVKWQARILQPQPKLVHDLPTPEGYQAWRAPGMYRALPGIEPRTLTCESGDHTTTPLRPWCVALFIEFEYTEWAVRRNQLLAERITLASYAAVRALGFPKSCAGLQNIILQTPPLYPGASFDHLVSLCVVVVSVLPQCVHAYRQTVFTRFKCNRTTHWLIDWLLYGTPANKGY